MKRRRLLIIPLIGLLLTLGLGVLALAEAEPEAAAVATSRFYQTFWSLLPPIIAIGLALITKEVLGEGFKSM